MTPTEIPSSSESEEVRVQRHASRERLGAVDGVEDPAPAGGPDLLGLLLAQDPVVGEQLLELLAHEALGLAVGDGDGRAVTLVDDVQLGVAEVLEREGAGLADDGDGCVEQLGIDGRWHGGHPRTVGRPDPAPRDRRARRPRPGGRRRQKRAL